MTEPRSWSPQPLAIGAAWAGAAVALAVTLLADVAATKVLLGTATVMLVLTGAYLTRVRPKLVVDDEALTVATATGTHRLPWHEVKVRLVHTRRLGRQIATLELDWARGEEEHLFVLTRVDLGTDPEDVAKVLHALRP